MALTVKELVETYKDLDRYRKYASRNMPTSDVREMEQVVAQAREILESSLANFENMNVRDLHSSNKDAMRQIRWKKDELKWKRDELDGLQEELNSLEEEVEDTTYIENEIDELTSEIETLEDEIANLEDMLEEDED